jgi:predicted DNA-binding protein (UPF0251 family)
MPLPRLSALMWSCSRRAVVRTLETQVAVGSAGGLVGGGGVRAMPRPRKHRRLSSAPQPAIFKPVGVPLEALASVTLFHEELEALRLTDLEGCHQETAAAQMGISRSSFQRVVCEARRKLVHALVHGAALHIEGGTFRVEAAGWRCDTCGAAWEVTHGSGQGEAATCPACHGPAAREPWDAARSASTLH